MDAFSVHQETATAGDIPVLTQVIADAFHDLAPSRWLIPDPDARRYVLPRYFRILVEHAVACGLVQTTPDRDAAALWFPAGTGSPAGPPGYEERLAAATGPYLEYFRLLDEQFRTHHPVGAAHEHLAILAVRPGRQRQGTATMLLDACHAELDRQHRPAYLEASDAGTRRIYLRSGYLDRGAPIVLPADGPGTARTRPVTMYPMWREPRRLPGDRT